MPDDKKTSEAPLPPLDERAVARKYGLRELIYPDSEQVKVLTMFLRSSLEANRVGIVPKTATVMMLEYLQGTINRQHITKGPRMSPQEFDLLQTPYYLAARIISKINRERQDPAEKNDKAKLYQNAYVSLNQFIDLLRNLLDPGCYWLRLKAMPEGIHEAMDGLLQFLTFYPEQRRKGRLK
ncbi:MAG TPA: hypothetical protein VGF48_18105 [Thermoanaerobaculia bacterium]|jgi:hypothetical protein